MLRLSLGAPILRFSRIQETGHALGMPRLYW